MSKLYKNWKTMGYSSRRKHNAIIKVTEDKNLLSQRVYCGWPPELMDFLLGKEHEATINDFRRPIRVGLEYLSQAFIYIGDENWYPADGPAKGLAYHACIPARCYEIVREIKDA